MGKDLKGRELGQGMRQKKNGIYEGRYVDRFGKRKSVYGKTKAEMKANLQLALEENAEKKSVVKRYTVSKWYIEWMDVYKIPVIRPNTKRHYEHIFEAHILPVIGFMYLEDVRQIHVKNLINILEKKGIRWETQNKVRILILDMFNIAIDNDYAIKNPAKGIKLHKGDAQERIVLELEQQADFFECSAGTFYDNLFVTAVNTGLRPGELFALEESDLNFSKKEISVTKTLIYQKFDGDGQKEYHLGPPKTDSSVRVVPMNEQCEIALRKQIRLKKILSRRHKAKGELANLLFVTRMNTPICAQVFNDAIKKIIETINLQRDDSDVFPVFSGHTFRHTFATRCIEAGILPKTLQKYLGHATLQMTMDLYVHVTDQFKQEELKKLENVMPKRKEPCLQVVCESTMLAG